MSTVSEKSTKKEILEAYNAAKEKLDAMAAMQDDPMKDVAKAEEERVATSAEKIAGESILNPEIIESYNDLKKDIANKQKTLKELYGIEAEANSMIAMINGHKEKEVELKEKYNALKDTLDAEIEEKKAEMKSVINALETEKKAQMEAIIKESKELETQLAMIHKRKEEEYDYDLKRKRKQENDTWNDTKATREKELAVKLAEAIAKEKELTEKETYIAELEDEVSKIPALIEEAKEEGVKKGKSDAEKSYIFEKRAIETKNTYELKSLMDKIALLEKDIQETKEANQILQDKLDSAYTQMRELASETVKSSGGVKILGREEAGK